MNPHGRDSQTIKCFGNNGQCQSEYHLIRDCPHESGRGRKGHGSSTRAASTINYVDSFERTFMITTHVDETLSHYENLSWTREMQQARDGLWYNGVEFQEHYLERADAMWEEAYGRCYTPRQTPSSFRRCHLCLTTCSDHYFMLTTCERCGIDHRFNCIGPARITSLCQPCQCRRMYDLRTIDEERNKHNADPQLFARVVYEAGLNDTPALERGSKLSTVHSWCRADPIPR